jgi:c-di-GMP-binding flagellar brake protein YcgR
MQRVERRKYPRERTNLGVEYTQAGQVHHTRALSLAAGGLFLQTPQDIPPGTVFPVRFRAAKHLPIIEAHARVRHQLSGKGVGVELTEIRPQDQQRILRLVLHRLEEKRQHPRKPFVTQVEHGGGAFLGFSKNISVGGMFIETKENVSEGSEIRLRFHLDDGGPIVIVSAEIRYLLEGSGVGVRFLDLSPADSARIKAIVNE